MKKFQFIAVSYYRMADECKGRLYGQQITWLQLSLLNIQKATSIKQFKEIPLQTQTDIKNLTKIIELELKKALKDNDMIYLEVVPDAESLTSPGTADLVTCTIPIELSSLDSQSGSLFKNLLPFAIHNGISLYVIRKEEFLKSIKQRFNLLETDQGNIYLQLGLPKSLDIANPTLPPNIIMMSETVRNQGIETTNQSFTTLSKMSEEISSLIHDMFMHLENESNDDKEMKRQFGMKWTRSDSNSLTKQIKSALTNYQLNIQNGVSRNQVIYKDFQGILGDIKVLCLSTNALQDKLPKVSKFLVAPCVDKIMLIISAQKDESKSRELIKSQLDFLALSDDVSGTLLQAYDRNVKIDYPSAFKGHIEKVYAKQIQSVEEAVEKHRGLMQSLKSTYLEFKGIIQNDAGLLEKEAFLSSLQTTFETFTAIQADIESGKAVNQIMRLM